MKIDIEKLNRKTPYPEPSEDFFKQMQANVISQTVGKEPIVVKKEAKIFALDFKWMAAAAVVLIAGITAFLGFSNDPEVFRLIVNNGYYYKLQQGDCVKTEGIVKLYGNMPYIEIDDNLRKCN